MKFNLIGTLSKRRKIVFLVLFIMLLMVSYPLYLKYSEYKKWAPFDKKLTAIGGTYQYACSDTLSKIGRMVEDIPYLYDGLEKIAYMTAWRVGLDCEDVPMTDELLSEMPADEKITEILLYNTYVTEQSIQSVAKFKNLKLLFITNCTITGKYSEELIKLNDLERLLFNNVKISAEAMQSFAKCKNLKSLEFYRSTIPGKGIEKIIEMEKLNVLVFSSVPVDDQDIKRIRKCKQINSLGLYGTKITDKCVSDLKKMKLKSLTVSAKNFSAKKIEELENSINQFSTY